MLSSSEKANFVKTKGNTELMKSKITCCHSYPALIPAESKKEEQQQSSLIDSPAVRK